MCRIKQKKSSRDSFFIAQFRTNMAYCISSPHQKTYTSIRVTISTKRKKPNINNKFSSPCPIFAIVIKCIFNYGLYFGFRILVHTRDGVNYTGQNIPMEHFTPFLV